MSNTGKRIIRKERRKQSKKHWILGFFILATHHQNKESYWVLMEMGRKYGNPVMVVAVVGIFLLCDWSLCRR
jgi:hypothetical protein